MKRFLVFMLLAVLIISCSSKKLLPVRKIAHNGVINNIASQYDFSQKQYNTLNNSKNSSAKNLSEVEASIPSSKNNQDFLASKDKIDPSVLTTNYSHKELPHFIQHEKINKSFLEKIPILKHREITKKKSKIKDKQNKILLVLLSIVTLIGSAIMFAVALYFLFFESFVIAAASLLICLILGYLSWWGFMKAISSGGRGLY